MNPLQIPFKQLEAGELPEYISATSFNGLFTIQRPVLGDERGDFWEAARIPDLEKAVQQELKIAQVNRSRNIPKGVLRGIHVADWYKLIFVVKGAAFIALIDLRVGSPTYGQHFSTTIGDRYETQSILVPPGFANSYQTLTETTDYMYVVTDMWAPGREIGILWNDPSFAIQWPIQPPVLSQKDQQNKLITELLPNFKKM